LTRFVLGYPATTREKFDAQGSDGDLRFTELGTLALGA
jgi:hypothetical protein